MPRSARVPKPAALVVLAAACAVSCVLAQTPPEEVTGTISQEAATRIALGLPPTEAGPGAGLTEAAEIGQVLRDDLVFSGWFGLVDPQGEARIDAARLREPKAWADVGAAYLVVTRAASANRQARFQVRLLETRSGTVLLDRTWGGAWPEDLRRLAHVASDAIVEQLTGRPGIAQTRIAYSVKSGQAKEIYLMDYDGARVRKLTSTGTINLSPEWSPDGRRLVFLSFLGRKPSIYMLDESGKVTTLRPGGGDLNSAPSFSPDGRTLAFSSDRDGNSEIYLMDVASGEERRLSNHPGIDTSPSWSPSGREIVFTSDRSGSPQLYLMSADGTNTRRLTYEGNYNESGAFSPDGTRIAFVSRLDGRFQIVIHDLASGKETILTSGPGNKENPRWSPDGRRLVFASDRGGSWSIYTITDKATDLRQLTRGGGAVTPDWSPVKR